ncbi:hypothetical protein LCGC14_0752830 [marine sediment metagenome]|uniref:Right handed beta helix domain-containing protein n=1 Tax=marine sediment metagenome TaxID=412755 RepID=A0A0F9Q7N4_9ZZZZ
MPTEVFGQEKSMFFVGGRGNGSGGVAEAGGCTQTWWDAEVAASDAATALAKLMGATGGPLINNSNLDYTHSTKRIDAASPGDFTNVEVGMVAYVTGLYLTTGRYKITEAYDDYIILSGIVSTADYNDTVLVIGGAFNVLNNACDKTDASNHSVAIHTNLSETLAGAITISSGGRSVRNTFKRIAGYNTLPGDMNRGGVYYQSPFDILLAGSIDNAKTVLLDGDGNNFEILNISDDNLVIENIHIYNTGTAAAIVYAGTPVDIVFRNCRISACNRVSNTATSDVTWDSCYTHDDLVANYNILSGGSHLFLHCVAKLNAALNWIHATGIHIDVIGCLVAGSGNYGIRPLAGAALFMTNNTFYNLAVAGVGASTHDDIIAFGNIFALGVGATAFDFAVQGSMSYNDYNCFIETDGTPLNVGTFAAGETPVMGPHSIAADPLFVDAASGNFRLKATSPCRRAGKLTIGAI